MIFFCFELVGKEAQLNWKAYFEILFNLKRLIKSFLTCKIFLPLTS